MMADKSSHQDGTGELMPSARPSDSPRIRQVPLPAATMTTLLDNEQMPRAGGGTREESYL